MAPWALYLAHDGASKWDGLAFLVAHTLLLHKLKSLRVFDTSKRIKDLGVSKAIVSLSFVLGAQRFGLAGVILGPLILTIARLAFKTLVDGCADELARAAAAAEDAAPDEPAVKVVRAHAQPDRTPRKTMSLLRSFSGRKRAPRAPPNSPVLRRTGSGALTIDSSD